MAILTALLAVLVLIVLTNAVPGEATAAVSPVPVWSLILLGGAALAVSAAELPRNVCATAGLLAAGLVLIGIFVRVERTVRAGVLPPSVFGRGPLKWVYLTMAIQMGAVMVDTYVPLFGQRLAHLTPVEAGFWARRWRWAGRSPRWAAPR